MAKLPTEVKYKGVVYRLRSAADISVSPGSGGGPGGTLILEREYPTESRGIYIDDDGNFFGKVKLDWSSSSVFDELTFDFDTRESAREFFEGLVRESGGTANSDLSKEELKQLWGSLTETKPPAGVDPSKVIDISGHYIRVSSLPADILRVREAAELPDVKLRKQLSEMALIEGRFCKDPFRVMGIQYRVPEHLVQLFAETLTDALQEHVKAHQGKSVAVDIAIEDSCGPISEYGGVYAFKKPRQELDMAQQHLERDVLLPVWREIWNAFQQGRLPAEEKKRALGSFKVKVLAAIRSEDE